jgi:hypothetical protein
MYSFGQIAQSVEQRTENPCVAGSIPVLAKTNPALQGFFLTGKKAKSLAFVWYRSEAAYRARTGGGPGFQIWPFFHRKNVRKKRQLISCLLKIFHQLIAGDFWGMDLRSTLNHGVTHSFVESLGGRVMGKDI